MWKIQILPQNEICFAKDGERLWDVLVKHSNHFLAPCGGKGLCGKCKVKLLEGMVDGVERDQDGFILSCLATVKSDLIVEAQQTIGGGLSSFESTEISTDKSGLGIILDIGTTTVAACLIDLKTGEILKKQTCLNPQGVFGADVLSRIQACGEGHLLDLQKVILRDTAVLIEQLAKGDVIRELVVAANTTMLHLFLGVDPSSIGVAPFTPVFTDTRIIKGSDLGLSVDKVRLLPSASAYIGADVTVGALACGLYNELHSSLLVDVGTNGELVLAHDGKLYATSTAAGPALEGACIECGMGGIAGAIDKVEFENGELVIHTIDSAVAQGICGSGLIDIIAVLVKEGVIDENGTWDEDCTSTLACRRKDDRLYLTETIYISQRDIRQFQLAKAAISAGIKTLLSVCGIDEKAVLNTYIAGGLGYYMNLDNAVKVGLFPKGLLKSMQSVGNSCLSGARLCLLSDEKQQEVEKMSKEIEIVDLSCSLVFQDAYMDGMGFDIE